MQWHNLQRRSYDHLGHALSIAASIKKDIKTYTNILGQPDSIVLINNREKDQSKFIYIHSDEADACICNGRQSWSGWSSAFSKAELRIQFC